MLYLGGVGIGKSYFCSALIGKMHGIVSYRYWSELELISSVCKEMDSRHSHYLESLKYKIDYEFLIVDDICGKIKNDWRNEIMFSLIDQRYRYNKPTLLTSNLSINQLTDELGERCMSRLLEKDSLILEVVNGQDLRPIGL